MEQKPVEKERVRVSALNLSKEAMKQTVGGAGQLPRVSGKLTGLNT